MPDPDPLYFGMPDPDPHWSETWNKIRIKSKLRSFKGSKWSHEEPWTLTMEAGRFKMEPWRLKMEPWREK
jgi:hypothetical protein